MKLANIYIPNNYAALTSNDENPPILLIDDCAQAKINGVVRWVRLDSHHSLHCFIGYKYTFKVERLFAVPGIIRKLSKNRPNSSTTAYTGKRFRGKEVIKYKTDRDTKKGLSI